MSANLYFTLRNVKINPTLPNNKTESNTNVSSRPSSNTEDTKLILNHLVIPNDRFLDMTGLVYPQTTNISCWHCKGKIQNRPFGIPVRMYKNTHAVTTPMIADLFKKLLMLGGNGSGENNTIKNKKCQVCNNIFETQNNSITKCVLCNDEIYNFWMVGWVCSFECNLAYIREYEHKEIFKESEKMLHFLYYRTFGTIKAITPAPDWRLLSEFSGDLSMNLINYRLHFSTTAMVDTPYLYLTPVGMYVQLYNK